MAGVTRRDYAEDAVAAARSVLIELTRLLGEYRDHIAVIGGWVPELLLARGAYATSGALTSMSPSITAPSPRWATV